MSGYWESVASRLTTSQTILDPAYGDEEIARELLARYAELTSFLGGGPPSCCEQPCPEEDRFLTVDLPAACESFIHDIAMSLGYEIGELRRYQDHATSKSC